MRRRRRKRTAHLAGEEEQHSRDFQGDRCPPFLVLKCPKQESTYGRQNTHLPSADSDCNGNRAVYIMWASMHAKRRTEVELVFATDDSMAWLWTKETSRPWWRMSGKL